MSLAMVSRPGNDSRRSRCAYLAWYGRFRKIWADRPEFWRRTQACGREGAAPDMPADSHPHSRLCGLAKSPGAASLSVMKSVLLVADSWVDHLGQGCRALLTVSRFGGWGRNRTGIDGFAGRCITTLPPSLGGYVGRGTRFSG